MSIADVSGTCLAAAVRQGRGVTQGADFTDPEHVDTVADVSISRPAQ